MSLMETLEALDLGESFWWTAVGSRKAPQLHLQNAKQIATALHRLGGKPRSGAAPGMDTHFELGITELPDWSPEDLRIYLPWREFGDRPQLACYVDTQLLPNYEEAKEIAKAVHPYWDNLKKGGIALHTRNVYQVLGDDLNSPSSFLVCSAPPRANWQVEGGTNTAVQLARQHNVPTINLQVPDEARIFAQFFKAKLQALSCPTDP